MYGFHNTSTYRPAFCSVSADQSKQRREVVRKKTAEYLKHAEELFQNNVTSLSKEDKEKACVPLPFSRTALYHSPLPSLSPLSLCLSFPPFLLPHCIIFLLFPCPPDRWVWVRAAFSSLRSKATSTARFQGHWDHQKGTQFTMYMCVHMCSMWCTYVTYAQLNCRQQLISSHYLTFSACTCNSHDI